MNQRRRLKIPINKKELASLREDSFVWFALVGAFLITLLILGLIVVFWRRLPPEVPLYYSRPWGEKQLATPAHFLILPGLCFLILVFNLVLTSSVFKEEVLMRRILMASSLLMAILSGITIGKIINLVVG